MDRSFLSSAPLIAASRDWVCIRLATYESAQEAKILENIFVGHSGQLENTVFALLSPDGRTPLTRPGRSPHQFQDGADLANTMRNLALKYPGSASTSTPQTPDVDNLRLALNVAACEHLPLVVSFAATPAKQKQLDQQLAPLAWEADLLGQAIYCKASLEEVRRFPLAAREGYLVVAPEEYGLDGTVCGHFEKVPSKKQLLATLRSYRPAALSPRQHIRQGHQKGVRWQTQVPVTDPAGRY